MSTQSSPASDRLAFAGVTALVVLTWYALPDALRSRPARCVVKSGLLGVTGCGLLMLPTVYPELVGFRPWAGRPPRTKALLAGASLAAGTVATLWFEKVVFARGEKRRAAGVRCAHTRQALALSVVCGAAAMGDWGRLAPDAG